MPVTKKTSTAKSKSPAKPKSAAPPPMAVEVEPEEAVTPVAVPAPESTAEAITEPAPVASPSAPASPSPAPVEPAQTNEPKVVKIGGKYVLDPASAPVPASTETTPTPDAIAAPASTPLPALPPLVDPLNPVTPVPTAPTSIPGHLTPLPPSATDASTSKYTLAEEVPLEKTNKKLYAIGITLLVIVLASTGIIFYLRMRVPEKNSAGTPPTTVTESPTPAVTTEPATKPSAGLTRDKITLEVLNGTKTPGLAGKTADQFKTLGYTIGKTGNSPDDATTNMLYIQKDLEGELDVLLSDVKSELNIATVSGYLTGTDASARIILGAK